MNQPDEDGDGPHAFDTRASEEIRFRRIFVAGCAGERASIDRVLSQFGCDVHEAEATLPSGGYVAAIIGDDVASPLDLCELWSRVCPVVFVSNPPSFETRLLASRSGVLALVERPVNATELSEWLSDLVSRGVEQSCSVLIVDDDGLMSEVHAAILQSAGMNVTMLEDPKSVLAHLEQTIPDLILMDVEMPEIDGIQLTRLIRQTRRFVSLPIVFLSGERDASKQIEARALGGDDFITKPVAPERLVEIVRLRADRSRVLRAMIERDRLTGVYNQTSFKERLSFELERCRRAGVELALALIDLDHFKSVNDTYGHAMGDAVLRALAGALLARVRQVDIVGRLGGEEFGIILLDTPVDAAVVVVDRLRLAFAGLSHQTQQRTFSVSFSAGVASSRQFHNSNVDIIAAADAALYEAKRRGRNAVLRATAAGSVTDLKIRRPE